MVHFENICVKDGVLTADAVNARYDIKEHIIANVDGSYHSSSDNEIVKQGSVSNDVCELRLLKGYKFLHETSCGYVFDMQNGFKYCPYCGKKIKVVG